VKESLWGAAALQLLVAAANVPAKRMLCLETELAKLTPMVRQIYRVQHAYIIGLLLFFAALSPLLARGGPIATLLSAMLSLFWGARLAVQLLYYDPGVRRRHRAADVFFSLTFMTLAAIFAAAAIGGLR
jgi:hypothetical protein